MPADKNQAFVIGVDWGTTSFRAYLMDEEGAIIEKISGPYGITQIDKTSFASKLNQLLSSWWQAKPSLPVVMCGMIGSAQGWVEAKYLTGSIGSDELSAGCIRVPDSVPDIWIIPGLQSVSLAGYSDVMRGEETLLVGAALQNIQDGLFCLPGTHSKWVSVKAGRIETISTFMTGELYHLCASRSILTPLIGGQKNSEIELSGFTQGLELASSSLGVLHELFAIRAGVLTGHFASDKVASILSGLLIGCELTAIATLTASGQVATGQAIDQSMITLVASGELKELYQRGLLHQGLGCQVMDSEQLAAKGLFKIARNLI